MLKVMYQGVWFDKDDPKQLAELERRQGLTKALLAEREAKRARRRREKKLNLARAFETSIDPEFDAWFEEIGRKEAEQEKRDAEWEETKRSCDFEVLDLNDVLKLEDQKMAMRAAESTARNLGMESVLEDEPYHPAPPNAYHVLHRLWEMFADTMEETEARRAVMLEFSSWWASEKSLEEVPPGMPREFLNK